MPEVQTLMVVKDGVSLAVYQWSTIGPVILLHHATGFVARIWDPVAELLQSEFRVIGFDAPGHGDSGPLPSYGWPCFVEVLVTLLTEMRLTSVIGVGHSIGGTVMLSAAARYPELFDRLVLVDPIILPPAPERNWTVDQREIALAERARRRRNIWPTRTDIIKSWSSRPPFSNWHHGLLELYVEYGTRLRTDSWVELKCPGTTEAAIYEGSAELDLWPDVGHIQQPVLVIRGSKSDVPAQIVRRLVHALPKAELQELSAGHLVPMEQPQELALMVRLALQ